MNKKEINIINSRLRKAVFHIGIDGMMLAKGENFFETYHI